jgi:drug/metabolite transporter (DMT)-like permease
VRGRLAAQAGLVLVTAFWAANYSLIQFILKTVPPVPFITVRFLAIAAAGWLLLALFRQSPRWRRRDIPRLVLVGVLGGGIYQYLFVEGLAATTSFSSALLNSVAPLLSLGLLAALRLEKIEQHHWVGYGIAFAGIALFLAQSRGAGGSVFRGNLVSLAAALCWAIYGILARELSHRYSPAQVGAWTYTACFFGIASYGTWPAAQFPWREVPISVWAAIFASGIGAVTIGWIVWVHGIRVLGLAGTAKFSFLVPVTAGAFAWIFQGEEFTAAKAVGAGAVLAGLLIARVSGWRTPPVEVEKGSP